MAQTLIIGDNSFIGNAIHSVYLTSTKISHKDIDNVNFGDFDVVINCALNPKFKTKKYNEQIDFDYKVASLAYKHDCHTVMLSTRKVYGSSNELHVYTEESELKPYDFYSENKLTSEKKIMAEFGDKATILRGSNLFGYELGRNSMMGYMLNQLDNTGRIVYNQNTGTQKDILFVNDAAELICELTNIKPTGVYNMGGGLFSLGTIGQYLIQGYGSGEVVCNSVEFGEQFLLDSSKLYGVLSMVVAPVYEEIFVQIGEECARSGN